MEEQPAKKVAREDNSGRKNSFNASKGPPLAKETAAKSTSVAKNYTASSLGNKQPLNNNLVGPNTLQASKTPLNNPSINKNTGGGLEANFENPRTESQFGLQRYNSHQQAVIGKKEEPMDIESPTNPPYYLPSKNVANSNKFVQQGSTSQQSRPGSLSQSQNISGNFSSLSIGHNLSSSQMNTLSPYGPPTRLNPGYNQPQQNTFYNNYSQPSFTQANFNQNSYNPNPQQGYSYPQQGQNYLQHGQNYPQHGKGQNYQNLSSNSANHNASNAGNLSKRGGQQQYQLP